MKPRTVGDLKKDLKQFSDNTPLVYACDDEGNGFDYIYYSPAKGTMDIDGDFCPDDDRFLNGDDITGRKVVCIN